MTEKQEIFTLLNGAIKLYRSKYNPTSDAVWLAALPKHAPKTVLDVGIGTGGVSLCLQHHFPCAHITGLDNSSEMLDVCANNAELNNFEFELINRDLFRWSTPKTYDLVVSNPPYFIGTPAKNHPNAHHNTDLTKWIKNCIARVRPRGYFCTIIDTGRTAEVISTIAGKFGDITIIPLFGSKKSAERVLVSARLGSHGATVIYNGFSMNDTAILRDGLTISNILSNI